MDPIQKRELKRQAWMRLAAQRRRAGLLRGRVVAISLVCFAALWGIVFVQMATGNDPVLSAKEKAVATRSARAARDEVETTDPRELEPARTRRAKARTDEGATEAEPESESTVEAEPEAEEAAPAIEEAEPEPVEEAEPAFEEVEPEPLVTSQS